MSHQKCKITGKKRALITYATGTLNQIPSAEREVSFAFAKFTSSNEKRNSKRKRKKFGTIILSEPSNYDSFLQRRSRSKTPASERPSGRGTNGSWLASADVSPYETARAGHKETLWKPTAVRASCPRWQRRNIKAFPGERETPVKPPRKPRR